jgi:hypothetical protein
MLSGGRARQGAKGRGSPRRWRDGGVAERIWHDGGGSPEGGPHCPEALLQLSKSEGEVRAEPNWRKGEEGARWRLSPQRGDDVGGAPMVGAVRKATGRGVCPWGALEGGRRRGKEPRRDSDTLLRRRWGEAGEGWGSGVGRHVEGGEARERGPGPDRRGTAWATWQQPGRDARERHGVSAQGRCWGR